MGKSSSPSDPLADAEPNSVRLANEAFYTAFQNQDLHQMTDIWARGAHVQCVHPGGEMMDGHDNVIAGWEEMFSRAIGIQIDLTDVSIYVNGTLARVTLHENMTMRSDSGLSKAVMVATNIFEKTDSRWRLIHHHSAPTPFDAPPPPRRTTLH